MGNEYYGAPTTPTSDYLAHYGIKGMKWGVRKVRESGNVRALGRQYRKAQKKLAKLERQAASGKKYAKRAALMGAGAAAAGGLAAAGTKGVASGIMKTNTAGRKVMQGVSSGLTGLGGAARYVGVRSHNNTIGKYANIASNALKSAGKSVNAATTPYSTAMSGAAKGVYKWGQGRHDVASAVSNISSKYGHGDAGKRVASALNKRGLGSVSNNTLARAGAGAVGAGLLAGAGYNAYRAATTKKAAAKAAQFRKEMNKAFAGTQYANGGGSKKRRRR